MDLFNQLCLCCKLASQPANVAKTLMLTTTCKFFKYAYLLMSYATPYHINCEGLS